MKRLLLIPLLFCAAFCCQAQELKPRLVVLTDIGPADVEPDDNESAVRLLSYADRFEIEAICTSIGWNCDPYPEEWAEYLNRVVDAYETDVKNLMKRSNQIGFMSQFAENGKQKLGYWPSAKYIRSRVMMGSKKAGIGVIGKDNDSPGSDFLIKLADENDPRPIWVTAWGGANTLAQAIWKVKQTRSPEDFKKFLHKFRLYTITDQDMQYSMRMDRAYSSHQWLRREFPEDLMLIWDESAWLNQNELGKQNWKKYAENIQNKGAMGKVYPTFKWGVEGDTPSFLHLMPNGLNDPNSPEQVGWGGYHLFSLSPDSITNAWTNWQPDVKSISDTYEKRFYPDEFNDFAARMAWAAEGKGNTNPIVIINGKKGISQIELTAKAGNYITIDASKSYDKEGNKLSFLWWQQKELGVPVQIFEAHTSVARILVPQKAKGHDLHIICEVRDNGPFRLVSYRRVIIKSGIVELSMLRKPYYDILRITAILLVLINHLPIYRLFMQESGMAEAGCLVISVVTRINVPLFAMISGALLLGREESYGDIWKKRMKNMLLVTVGCSALLYLAFGLLRDRDLSLDTFLYGLLAGNLKDFDSYWFLYAYIGFLLFLPFYRHIAQQMTKGDFFLLLGVHATMTTVLPLINLMFKSLDLQQLTISSSISTTIAVTPLVFYPLIGYYVDKKIDVMSISKKGWATLGTATALGIAITAIAVYAEGKAWGFTQNLLNLFTFVVVIAFFLGIKRLYCQPDSNSPTLFVRMMTFLSPLCFGVYLLDPVLKLALYEPLKSALRPTIGYAGFSVVMCLVSFVCCSAVTWCFLKVRKRIIHKKKG